jgi:methionine synthase II (cobalamin-independent)
MQLPPIAATTIGSFPRPNWLAQPDRARVIFRLEGDALKEAQDDATALSIHMQEHIGLDCSPTANNGAPDLSIISSPLLMASISLTKR